MKRRLIHMLTQHEHWRGKECLNLVASENVTSTKVRRILGSDLGHRYTAPDKFYLGSKFTDEVEETVRNLVCEIFGSQWADVTPLSGHVADMALLSTFVRPGDKIMTVNTDQGGYPGIAKVGYPRILSIENLHFPFDKEKWNIKVDETIELIAKEKPKLVIFGASYILFPHPVEHISKACLETGTTMAYDGSHILGLIAGDAFQQPLREGARILTGSTHKSLFGPQGGIIASFNEEGKKLKQTIFPALVDNAHWNRIAALGQALLEVKRFGRQYAKQVIRNSRALAEALDDGGVRIRCREYGYTASHQVLLDMEELKEANTIPERLQEANVIVDRGIRLGTSEMTRRGMREKEMNDIADIICSVVIGRETPHAAKKRAVALSRRFSRLHYA